jgi:uncharacterized iron-regulated protein
MNLRIFRTVPVLIGTLCLSSLFISACTMKPAQLKIEGLPQPLAVGTIYDTAQNEAIDFETLIRRLAPARVIYVGEEHTAVSHHRVQLKVLKALVDSGRHIRVGMEMFDHTYQVRLDEWSAGKTDWQTFLKRTQWYANWKFDDTLYKDILVYIKEKRLKLIGLNIPFYIPPRISTGGLDNLLPADRAQLPRKIDTTQAEHRAYIQEIFKMHHLKGRGDFENFYAAQCAWEDGMAQRVAGNLADDTMVVFVGEGHIRRKYGIPDRAFERNGAPFLTIYPAMPHQPVSLKDGDFIWVTEGARGPMQGMRRH